MVGGGPDVLAARFVLPDDLLIVPVSSLAAEARATIACGPGDFAVARPRSRRPSSIVDAETAALLERFRRPRRLVEAVVELCRATDRDPQVTLEEAFPALQSFCNGRILVPEDSEERHGIRAGFVPGQLVAGWEILRPVRVLDDTELYQARGGRAGRTVALKIDRRSGEALEPVIEPVIEREAAILRRLDGRHAPRVVEEGRFEDRPFLAAEWKAGTAITTAADELRAEGPSGRRRLLALCDALLGAYEALHRRGVVHGDVHPGNILADRDGTVSVLDFGASRLLGGDGRWAEALRVAVGTYYDPETAAAVLDARMPPAATQASDQYALAVLVYRMLSGKFPVDFRAEQEELLRQVVAAPPLPFARRGAAPWPGVEAVLRKALAKAPGERFASVARMRRALAEAPAPPTPSEEAEPLTTRPGADLVAAARRLVGLDTRRFLEGPRTPGEASLWTGAAGIAWFLYRLARVRGDAAALAAADAWVTRTASRPAATRSESTGPQAVGSPFHSAAGLHAVGALVARARGDRAGWGDEVAAFLAAPEAPGDRLELALGRSGKLLVAAVLLESDGEPGTPGAAGLRSFVERRGAEIGAAVAAVPDLGTTRRLPHLGLAHGWAGVLFALLRAAKAVQAPAPGFLERPLEQLARLACPAGRGLLWPGTLVEGSAEHTPDHAPGWCSGSAGYVHLWLAAFEGSGESRYLDLAERAAWAAWEHPDGSPGLCCGVAGRGLALLALDRAQGAPEWRRRAGRLAARAALPDGDTGLFKGALGPALLAVELEDPEWAVMPLFGA